MKTSEEIDSVGAMLARVRWSKATQAERLEQGRKMTAGRMAARKRKASTTSARSSKDKHRK